MGASGSPLISRSARSELADAAVVDGCGWFKMFLLVYLPLARPAVVAVSILVFMGCWNTHRC